MTDENRNVAQVRDYLRAIEAGATGETLAAFYAPHATQIEWPNRLNPKGQTSDLASLLARAEKGRHLLSSQRYDVQAILADGDQVALHALWEGVLAVPVGTLAAGDRMRAHMAVFFTLADGRIVTQHSFDCFEAW